MQNLTNEFITRRSSRQTRARCAWTLAFLPLLFTHIVQAQTATATIPTGALPFAVVVNPVSNKTYVANRDGNTVTVIDGANNKTTTLIAGANPTAVAVNPITNKIYVANFGSANVTVIDGATNTTENVDTGVWPFAVAVNPVTNKAYVANFGTNNITVIDGATNTTATVPLPSGSGPFDVAVNPVTNKIYVSNYDGASVTVIDGVTNNTTTVATGSQPFFLAVNPVTNKIYVPNNISNTVTVIDGATNKTTTLAAGSGPFYAAVNPVTNKIYISNEYSNNVTVIDGATNNTTTVAIGGQPQAAAVNPVTNKIYIAGDGTTVIDGATNTVSTVAAGSEPFSLAVNPVTNKIYVGNEASNDVTVIDGATNNNATVATGPEPSSVAVNPVTNKIYVANYVGANVTVIDGTTNSTTTIAAGTGPISVAVNPVTNKIYVANAISNDVTVIDGATNNATTVANVSQPYFVVVNPVTNKIYVVSNEITKCTVIDGETNTASTVTVGFGSLSAAVNPVTNKIYVANDLDASVTVIDGATSTTTTVYTGGPARFVAVNPVTNKIYVANGWGEGDYVTVIDGATNGTTNIASGGGPASVAVNPITNKIYVANSNSNNVTVIDGATNDTTTIAAGTSPISVAVNAVTNKIYVGNDYGNNVTIIDGATNTTTTVAAGTSPSSVAVNPVTNQVYVANSRSNNVTVIAEANTQAVPLTTGIATLTNNQSFSTVPGFTFTATSTTVTQADALFYQFDTWQSTWTAASGSNPTFTGSPATLQPGFHILYAYATDGQEATSTQASPQIGNIQAYGFLVLPAAPASISTNAGTTPQSTLLNSAFPNNLAVTVTDASNNPVAGVAVTFTAPSTGASGTFSNGTDTIAVQTNTSGIATAPFTANANAGVYSVTASAGNAATSFLLTNGPLNIPTGPAISNIRSIIVGGTSALITWTTDQPSTSQVNYGPTSSYGSSSPLDNNLVTSHSVTLSNLSADATYNYDVVSTNVTNGTTTSNNATFNASPYVGYVAFWGITANGVTISWSTDAPATTFVAYGATAALGQLSPVQTALSNSHGLVLTGLNPGTTYYFRAESTTAGGSTGASTLYSFTTTGTPTSPAPLISNVTVANITTTSATISWITDQSSTTQVNYGTTTAYGSNSPLGSGLVTSHSVTLTGLTPGATYDFDVISTNSSGTSGISSNSTFQTAALVSAPPVITNIQTTVTSTTATITWTTDQAANSAVNYFAASTTSDSNYVTSHSVTLTGLAPASLYSFSVISTNAGGLTTTSPVSTFYTTAANATAPYVGYLAFWGVNNSGVTISWSTDLPANTEVAYGTTAALGQFSPVQGALTNSHGVVLTGLASGTTYYFVAQSTAANGATGYSTTYSFTTTGSPSAPAPVISNIQAAVTITTATITWTTDEASTSQVNYGVTTTYSASSTLNSTLTTSHSVTLTNLMPGTTYDFDVVSSNANSLSSTSSNSTFQTTGSAPGPAITSVAASSITSSTALITWTTDQASTSVVNYGASTNSDPTFVTSHSLTLSGLTPNTTYTFSVTSVNSGRVSSTSSTYTFTTSTPSAPPPAISYLAFWGITSSGITISWSTDVQSNTSLAYGTTNAFGQVTPVQTALTNSHGVVLTGLPPSTTYYFQAQSADVNGNTGYSTTYSFTTLAGPPSVSNVIVTPAAGNTATISWTTSVPTNSYVQCGPSAGNYNGYSPLTSLNTTPQCTLPFVASGTVHYQLVSTDANGNQSVSPDATFVEP